MCAGYGTVVSRTFCRFQPAIKADHLLIQQVMTENTDTDRQTDHLLTFVTWCMNTSVHSVFLLAAYETQQQAAAESAGIAQKYTATESVMTATLSHGAPSKGQ